jgi:pyruvate/2-oxoglutarate dehydrogenase complex dihydrolipoamide acyltransferase (E2) component
VYTAITQNNSETMATSAQNLSMIIDEMLTNKPADRAAAMLLLSAKGLLPKKLLEPPKEKKTSRFASKAAEDFAEAKGITVPDDFKGTAANDKISVKDLKTLAEPPKKKVNASPGAQQFARDNGIDIETVTGTGENGKVLLKDVKTMVSEPATTAAVAPDDKMKISPSAAKLMKQHDWDEDDVSHIQGSGKNGTLLAKDLAEMVKETLEEEEGEETDPESDSEALFTE